MQPGVDKVRPPVRIISADGVALSLALQMPVKEIFDTKTRLENPPSCEHSPVHRRRCPLQGCACDSSNDTHGLATVTQGFNELILAVVEGPAHINDVVIRLCCNLQLPRDK